MQTLGELKTAVADWLNREDPGTIARIPQFIRLAESEIYRNLRCHDNEFIATYVKTGWSIDGGTTQAPLIDIHTKLPPNFSEMTLVRWNDMPLKQLTDTEIADILFNRCYSETVGFCITGRKIQFVSALPADPAQWTTSAKLEFTYYGVESLNDYPTWQLPTNPVELPVVENLTPQAIAQTDGNTTRMLQRNPDLYLHGVLYYACLFLKSKETPMWKDLFQNALESLRIESNFGKVTGSISTVSSVGGQL